MSKLFPTIDEFECPGYRCKDCVHFKYAYKGGCNKRFNHSKMEYAHPWFVSSPEENGPICDDFEPDGLYKAAMPFWHGVEHYREWLHRQNIEDWNYAGLSEEKILAKLEGMKCRDFVGFELKQEENVRYYVPGHLYRSGKMFHNNKLLAVKKAYIKHGKVEFGIQLYNRIEEDIDGVIVK